jgi:hypothetical protein
MCSPEDLAGHKRAANFIESLHRDALAKAGDMGARAFSAGILRSENPFRDLPPIHPLRELWAHHWDLACAAAPVAT